MHLILTEAQQPGKVMADARRIRVETRRPKHPVVMVTLEALGAWVKETKASV